MDRRKFFFGAALCILTPHAVRAQARPYRIDTSGSRVQFHYQFGNERQSGEIPLAGTQVMIDLAQLNRSRISVRLHAARARAGFAFATQALRGPQILDTGRYPWITFTSRDIQGNVNQARIDGVLTARGVTRPVSLNAGLFRQPGGDPAQLDHLSIKLTGSINRHDFGASGYRDYVGPRLDLDIDARISRL